MVCSYSFEVSDALKGGIHWAGRGTEKGCREEGGAVGGEESLALGHREREGEIRNIQTDG